MNSGHDGNWSVDSWKESVRLTMVNQESVFKDQVQDFASFSCCVSHFIWKG